MICLFETICVARLFLPSFSIFFDLFRSFSIFFDCLPRYGKIPFEGHSGRQGSIHGVYMIWNDEYKDNVFIGVDLRCFLRHLVRLSLVDFLARGQDVQQRWHVRRKVSIQRFMVGGGGLPFSFRALISSVEIPAVVMPLSVKPVVDGLFR